MGSVKSVKINEMPKENEFGSGIFEFSDDYSVFDYGKMPDIIPKKGECLARMATWNFLELEKLGIKTHFLKYIEPNKMVFKSVRVLYPGKDEITAYTKNYLIPLEIIFRNSLPAGSSVFKALESGEIIVEDLGLKHMPEPGEKLERPIIDITTKLEETDRRIDWGEAKRISALTDAEVEKIIEIVFKINHFITKRANEIGIEHADGKVELAFGPNREIILVDVCGTPDENRFLYNNFHISKQVLRDYYKKTSWYEEMEKAKVKGKTKNEWPIPTRLPGELINAVSEMYKATCEMWTGETVWRANLQRSILEIKRHI